MAPFELDLSRKISANTTAIDKERPKLKKNTTAYLTSPDIPPIMASDTAAVEKKLVHIITSIGSSRPSVIAQQNR
eukprot:CAMPEP_0113908242 /NCGR_PEP_ID=MMETSP0780_2-20120614/26030_1 /TAXON_ID=652834 /ORGANISM="Palpitomonas bilix" /LENGTH=74 /DNA_ID=CAMNT_0000903603 /DNA_START=174 /DNA_END=398 /DNA_ORIENTATION=+ /assembly_acc=CAM_ASM_000599